MSLSRLALASLAVWESRILKGAAQENDEGLQPREERRYPQILRSLKGMPKKTNVRVEILHKKNSDIHQPNTLANSGGKRV
jgi:hypothetical protein